MKDNEPFSIQARIKSFYYAFKGLKILIKNEHNARIHLAAAALSIVLGILFSISTTEWLFVLLAISLVFICEAFNSALEYLADYVSPGHRDIIGKAKDSAAAGVLIAAIFATFVGIIVFAPKI